jgi:hypothetical protein
MMARRLSPLLAALIAIPALAISIAPGEARADQLTDDLKAAARDKGEKGLALFKQEKYAEAYLLFEEADGLFHAPTLVLFMGHCRKAHGRLIEARDLYRRLADEPVPPGSPEQFRKAQASAREELAAVSKRIGRLTVVVSGPGADVAKVTIDGKPAVAADLAGGKEIDPGAHAVAAEAGEVRAARSVSIGEGAAAKVELVLAAPPKIVAHTRGSILPGAIALGAGGVGLLAGTITGALAIGKINDISSRCGPADASGQRHCLASDIPEGDAAQTLRSGSIVAFVLGGAAVAAGVTLLVLRPGGGDRAEPASVSFGVGPGSLLVRGSF